MKVRSAIRKTVKWGGAVAFLLLVAVWVASGWWYAETSRTRPLVVTVCHGLIQVFDSEDVGSPNPNFKISAGGIPDWGNLRPRFRWSFGYARAWAIRIGTLYSIPLWFPTLLVLIPTTLAWRADRRATRRARIGHCPACGYDRRGLAAGSVCPECGAAANAGAAS